MEIDRIDVELVGLLSERAGHVLAIGEAKNVTGDQIYQPDREARVIKRALEANHGPLEDAVVQRLLERVLDEARRLERSKRAEEFSPSTGS